MPADEIEIRDATLDDVPAFNAIYNRFIVGSHVSFDTEPWTDGDRTAWLADRNAQRYPVLVATHGSTVVGASWAGPWRSKRAYAETVETTIVLDPDVVGRGIGSTLYQALIERAAAEGFTQAIAVIALPNDASVALHRAMGYREVGVLDEVGHKDDRYVSTMLMQRPLRTS